MDRRLIFCIVFAMALLFPVAAFAGAGDGSYSFQFLSTVKAGLLTFLSVLLSISFLGSIVVLIYRLMLGRHEAVIKLISAIIAFGAGFVLLRVFGNIGGKTAASGLFYAVREALQIMLSGIAMINVTRLVIKIINGEEGSYFKLYFTVIVCVIGFIALQLVGASGVSI